MFKKMYLDYKFLSIQTNELTKYIQSKKSDRYKYSNHESIDFTNFHSRDSGLPENRTSILLSHLESGINKYRYNI